MLSISHYINTCLLVLILWLTSFTALQANWGDAIQRASVTGRIDVSGGNATVTAGPTRGGRGGNVVILVGADVETGNGKDGIAAGNITLEDETRDYVCVSGGTQFFIKGDVTINCQEKFFPIYIFFQLNANNQPPRLTVNAGHAIEGTPKEYEEFHLIMAQPWGPWTDVHGNGVDGPSLYFSTTDLERIEQLRVIANGGKGLNGGDGGDGGFVYLRCARDAIYLSDVVSSGGAGSSATIPLIGGKGGNGGRVGLEAPRLELVQVTAHGALGGNGTRGKASHFNGFDGGKGGSAGGIAVYNSGGGDLKAQDIDIKAFASGGQGGSGGSGYSPGEGLGRSGGRGGTGGSGGNKASFKGCAGVSLAGIGGWGGEGGRGESNNEPGAPGGNGGDGGDGGASFGLEGRPGSGGEGGVGGKGGPARPSAIPPIPAGPNGKSGNPGNAGGTGFGLSISPPPRWSPSKATLVLAIGVKYPPKNHGMIDDTVSAQKIAEAFLACPNLVVAQRVVQLDAEDPTQASAIEAAITEARSWLKPDDQLVFFYAGHSEKPQTGTEPAVMIEGQARSGNNLLSVSEDFSVNLRYSDDNIASLFSDSFWSSIDKLFVIDSCLGMGFWDGPGDLGTLPRSAILAAAKADAFAGADVYTNWDETSYHLIPRQYGVASIALYEALTELRLQSEITYDQLKARFEAKGGMFEGRKGVIHSSWIGEDNEILINWQPAEASTPDFSFHIGAISSSSRLLKIKLIPNNFLRLELFGPPGQYALESRYALTPQSTWSELLTTNIISTSVMVDLPRSASTSRFFRFRSK